MFYFFDLKKISNDFLEQSNLNLFKQVFKKDTQNN